MECPICMNYCSKDKTITLRCNHTFCKTCISKWISTNSTCPCCRYYITNINIHRAVSFSDVLCALGVLIKQNDNATDPNHRAVILDTICELLLEPIGLSFLDKNHGLKNTFISKLPALKLQLYSDNICLPKHFQKSLDLWCPT